MVFIDKIYLINLKTRTDRLENCKKIFDSLGGIFSNFEKMCYFAAKYYMTNIVINVPRTLFYLNYINPNVNIIYQII